MGNGALPHGPSYRANPRLYHRDEQERLEFSVSIGGAAAGFPSIGGRGRFSLQAPSPLCVIFATTSTFLESATVGGGFSAAMSRNDNNGGANGATYAKEGRGNLSGFSHSSYWNCRGEPSGR